MSAATDAIQAAQAAIEAAAKAAGGSLERTTPAQMAPVKVKITAAIAAVDARLTAIESLTDETSVGGVVVGKPVTAMITSLVSQAKFIREASALRDAVAYLKRLDKNIRTIAG